MTRLFHFYHELKINWSKNLLHWLTRKLAEPKISQTPLTRKLADPKISQVHLTRKLALRAGTEF